MGLLDAARQYLNDAAPGGLLNPEWTPERTDAAKSLLGLTPVVGDAVSAFDAIQSARAGQWGDAALSAVGLVPLVPSLGGMAIDPKAKARLIADLMAGKGSGTYRLGDVTPGQLKRLETLLGKKTAGPDVLMTDKTLDHVLEKRILGQNFTPQEVGDFAEQAMRPRSAIDLDPAKAWQNPALLNRDLFDPVSGRRFDARMPLGLLDSGGLGALSVVPDRLPKRKGPVK